MARGGRGNNNNDGRRGGSQVGPGRGRGRGGRPKSVAGGPYGSSMFDDDLQLVDRALQGSPARNQNIKRAPTTPVQNRGRGRGQAPQAQARIQVDPPFYPSPRGRGQGIGNSSMSRGGRGSGAEGGRYPQANLAPSLSTFLNRPLLRPIVFVRSESSRVLFSEKENEEEDELVPVVTPLAGEDDDREYAVHAPTADKVMQVFGGSFNPPLSSSLKDEAASENGEEIEEIDFSELARLVDDRKKWNAKMIKLKPASEMSMEGIEEKFTGVYIRPTSQMEDQLVTSTRSHGDAPAVLTTHTPAPTVGMAVDTSTNTSARPVSALDVVASAAVNSPRSGGAVDLQTAWDNAKNSERGVGMLAKYRTITDDPPLAAATEDTTVLIGGTTNAPAPSAPSNTFNLIAKLETSASGNMQDGDMVETSPFHPFVVDSEPTFMVDTEPSPLSFSGVKPRVPSPPPVISDDEEVIVYVAPHPRMTDSAAETRVQQSVPEFKPYQGLGMGTPFVPAGTPATNMNDFSFNLLSPAEPSSSPQQHQHPGSSTPRLQLPPIATPRVHKMAMKRLKQKEMRDRSKGEAGRLSKGRFAGLGAMMSEKELHEEYDFAFGYGGDLQRDERRKGDSDLDWGDEEKKEGQHEVDKGGIAGGGKKGKNRKNRRDELAEEEHADAMDMEVDVDIPIETMQRFVDGLIGNKAGVHISSGDIEDQEKMRIEDEEGDDGISRGNSGESENGIDEESDENQGRKEDVLMTEEVLIMKEYERVSKLQGEGLSDDDSDDEEEDEDELQINEALLAFDDDEEEDEDEDEKLTPRSKFATRLEKLRERSKAFNGEGKRAKGKGRAYIDDDFSEDDEDGAYPWGHGNWGMDSDEDYHSALIAQVQDTLDENSDILEGRSRRERKKIFSAIVDGAFEYDDIFPRARRGKDKRNGVPEELRAQWDKDRVKKAAYKAKREAERLERAADPFTVKKGGKVMLSAASQTPAMYHNPITALASSNRIIDMTSLIQMMRRFAENVGGKMQMSLPPTSKETRKNVHELAIAFGLKSSSKGKGDARYVTLTKTTRTGLGRIDEKKIGRIARRAVGMGEIGNDSSLRNYGGRGAGGKGQVPKHREGDEVGGKAPKIDSSNVGFRMLAMMGWAEGETIGGIGGGVEGLSDPLVAIVKLSKLGLGAKG